VTIITIRVPEELKKKLERFPEINWSEVVRQAIEARVHMEMARRQVRDRELMLKAFEAQDAIAAKTSKFKGEWSGVEVIRWWREHRYSSSTPQ